MGHCTTAARRTRENSTAIAVGGTRPHSSKNLASGLYGFSGAFGGYSFNFWLPLMMRSTLAGSSNTVVGLGVMVPNLLGVIAMILVSRHSDRTLERRYHLAASVTLAGMGMLLLG